MAAIAGGACAAGATSGGAAPPPWAGSSAPCALGRSCAKNRQQFPASPAAAGTLVLRTDCKLLPPTCPLFCSVDTPGKFFYGQVTKSEPKRKVPAVEVRQGGAELSLTCWPTVRTYMPCLQHRACSGWPAGAAWDAARVWIGCITSASDTLRSIMCMRAAAPDMPHLLPLHPAPARCCFSMTTASTVRSGCLFVLRWLASLVRQACTGCCAGCCLNRVGVAVAGMQGDSPSWASDVLHPCSMPALLLTIGRPCTPPLCRVPCGGCAALDG